jgi:hypothetical protein
VCSQAGAGKTASHFAAPSYGGANCTNPVHVCVNKRKEFQMAYVIRHIVNDGSLVELGQRLSDQGPFDSREEAEQRLNDLERDKTNGKFTIEELVLR